MKDKKILVTGGAGFIGTHLVEKLIHDENFSLVVFDKLDEYPDNNLRNKITYVKGNIISQEDLKDLFENYGPFETIFHLASEMPNKLADSNLMMQTNVVGTANLAKEASNNKTKTLVFTSSNVTYGIPHQLPVNEDTPVNPLEVYGKSKVEAEKVLRLYKDKMNIQIFRCPVVAGVGRLGLQAILYGFISENKNVYVLGGGNNKYQFVDVEDVVSALIKASRVKGFDIYVIGADEVLPLRELYKRVINFAGSTSKIISLPSAPAFFVLWILDKLNYSPLGIYQITMMGRSIYADTKKIKQKLGWIPKKTNEDTFIENYKWYLRNKEQFTEIGGNLDSPNRSVPKMGILKIVKLFS